MGHLGIVLYEYLGEEYPEVLGSILGALKVWNPSLIGFLQYKSELFPRPSKQTWYSEIYSLMF